MALAADVIGLGILLSWKDKATAEIKKAERSIDNLGESVDETTEKTARLQAGFASLGKVGAGITAFGIAGAATLYGLTKAASTFQDALIDTMTMTGLTGDAFKKMEKEMGVLSMNMSTRFGMSAADINKSFYQVLSSGAQAGTEQFKVLSESALMLAKTVGMEPAVVVEALSDVLHSFEMDVKSAEKMADVFFKTSMQGATTVPQIADAMKEASKVAVEMRIPLQDVAAVLVGLAGKGIKGAEAGTAFRMVMTKLAAPAKDAQEALAKLGVQIYDSTTKEMRPLLDILADMKKGLGRVTHEEREAALKAITGEEAFAKLGGLLASDLSLLKGWSKELKTGGVIQTAFSQKSQTLSFTFDAMRESLRNVAIVLGQQLFPVLTPIFSKIAVLAGKVREFLSTHPGLTKTVVLFGAIATAAALVVGPILTIAGLVGALGGIPAILGMVSAGFISLGSAAVALGGLISAAFWPVTAVVAAIALLYFAIKTNFLGIRTIVLAVGKVIWSFYKGVWEGIKSALSPLIQTFKEVWVSLKEAFAPLVEVGRQIGQMLGLTSEGGAGLESFSDIARTVGKVIGFSLVLPTKLLLTSIAYLIKGFAWLVKGAQQLGVWLGEKLAPHFNTIKTVLLYLLGPIGIVIANFNRIKTAVSEVLEWISSNWSTIKDIILSPVDIILEGWTALKEGLTDIFTSVRETVFEVFNSIKDSIAGILDWLWSKITWVIAKIPDIFLPESLKKLKIEATTPSFERPVPVGGQMLVPATAPAVQRAEPKPTFPRETFALPKLAFAGAGAGDQIDQSINISPGAIVIHATKIDESVALKIDRELAKLLERRRERR